MVVDVIYPGWMPWRRLGVGQDIPGIFAQVDEIKKMRFDTLVAGHVARTGTHADVDVQSAFMGDLRNAAGQALRWVRAGSPERTLAIVDHLIQKAHKSA